MQLGFKTFEWDEYKFEDLNVIEPEESGDGKRYYVTPSNKKVPSMTSLLSLLDDGGIQKWRDRVGEEEANRITKESTDRGNDFHFYNEEYMQNRLQRSQMKGVAKLLFGKAKPFIDDLHLIHAIEAPLYNERDGYAGRVDCIASMYDVPMIVDHKNSRRDINFSKQYQRRKFFKYSLQLCGYARALRLMTGINAPVGRLVVGIYDHNEFTGKTILKAEKIQFELKKLEGELDILCEAYHNDCTETLKRSKFFAL